MGGNPSLPDRDFFIFESYGLNGVPQDHTHPPPNPGIIFPTGMDHNEDDLKNRLEQHQKTTQPSNIKSTKRLDMRFLSITGPITGRVLLLNYGMTCSNSLALT